jgi:hypothetical protein
VPRRVVYERSRGANRRAVRRDTLRGGATEGAASRTTHSGTESLRQCSVHASSLNRAPFSCTFAPIGGSIISRSVPRCLGAWVPGCLIVGIADWKRSQVVCDPLRHGATEERFVTPRASKPACDRVPSLAPGSLQHRLLIFSVASVPPCVVYWRSRRANRRAVTHDTVRHDVVFGLPLRCCDSTAYVILSAPRCLSVSFTADRAVRSAVTHDHRRAATEEARSRASSLRTCSS